MFGPVDDHEPLVLVDLVDDVVVAAARDPEAFESADERPAEHLRVPGERAVDGLGDGGEDLLGKPVERSSAFGCDPEVVHPVDSEEIAQGCQLAVGGFQARLAKRVHQLVVAEYLDGFLQGLQIVGAQDDERRPAVASHEDAIPLALHPIGQLGEMRLGLGEGKSVAHDASIGQIFDLYLPAPGRGPISDEVLRV